MLGRLNRKTDERAPDATAAPAGVAESAGAPTPRRWRVCDSVTLPDGRQGIVASEPKPEGGGVLKVRVGCPHEDARTSMVAMFTERADRLEPGPERPWFAVGEWIHYKGMLARIVGENSEGLLVNYNVPMAGGAVLAERAERVPQWFLRVVAGKHFPETSDG